MKRVIDVSDTLYKTCKRLVSEGDPRPSESCIANSEPYEPQGEWTPVSKKLPEKELRQWINTRRATTNALLELINDLAPIIGYDEARRLVNIIGYAQKDDEE